MKKNGAILVASFGTTHIDALEKQIEPIEAYLERSFPDYSVYAHSQALWSSTALKRHGVAVDTPDIALGGLRALACGK
jgi:sirohydrochlorin cobaltochelatase